MQTATGGGRMGTSTLPFQGRGSGESPRPPLHARLLLGEEKKQAAAIIKANHYSHTFPTGKTYVVQYGDALVVWSLAANPYIVQALLGAENKKASVWELLRLWAPDGHEKNLLTRAISGAIKVLLQHEKPDVLVAYADPNQKHHGGVYYAASWVYTGQSPYNRGWERKEGTEPAAVCDHGKDAVAKYGGVCSKKAGDFIPRRHFHSGRNYFVPESAIKAMGFKLTKVLGKHRFVFPVSKLGKAKYPR